jgi:hypothetical protein
MLCVLCLLLLTCTTYHSVSRVLVSDLVLLNTARFVSSELSALLYSVLLHKSGFVQNHLNNATTMVSSMQLDQFRIRSYCRWAFPATP